MAHSKSSVRARQESYEGSRQEQGRTHHPICSPDQRTSVQRALGSLDDLKKDVNNHNELTNPSLAVETIRQILGHLGIATEHLSPRELFERLQQWYKDIEIGKLDLIKKYHWIEEVTLGELPAENRKRLREEEE